MNVKTGTENRERRHDGLSVRVSLIVYLIALAAVVFGKFDKFASYFVAIVLHEIAHAAVANGLGYKLNEFRLMPYGAALVGSFDDASARDEYRIAIAGPLANVIIAVLCAALWWFVPVAQYVTEDFVFANVTIAATNVLPVYPLDGGRIVLAFASKKKPREYAYKRLRIVGFVIGGVFAAAFVASLFYGINPTFASMSAFMVFSALIPDKHCAYRRLYQVAYRAEKARKGLPLRTVVISASAPARTLLRSLNSEYYTEFRVVDENFAFVATVTETDLEQMSGTAFSGMVRAVVEAVSEKAE